MKKLCGTKLDVFGYTAECRMERVRNAALPKKTRGFSHVKETAVRQYREERKILLEKFEASLHGMPHAA